MQLQQSVERSGERRMGRIGIGKQGRREERQFYLFIAPWIIGLILFDAGPIVASLLVSLTDWSLLSAPKWVGFANYVKMANDQFFYTALWNSIYFGVGSVGLGLIVSFLLALLLNQKVPGI